MILVSVIIQDPAAGTRYFMAQSSFLAEWRFGNAVFKP